jgi:hypothetical protein
MADDFDQAGHRGAARRGPPTSRCLLRRTARLAHEFLCRNDLPRLWEESKFPATEKKIIAVLALQFTRFGRLVVDSRRHPWVCFGMTLRSGPQLSLWIEVQRGHAALFKLAESLPPPWTRHPRDDPPWVRRVVGDHRRPRSGGRHRPASTMGPRPRGREATRGAAEVAAQAGGRGGDRRLTGRRCRRPCTATVKWGGPALWLAEARSLGDG